MKTKIKPGRRPEVSMEERFWEKVNKTDGCWEWTGALSKDGAYGMFFKSGKHPTVKAHRVSWMFIHGEIDSSVKILHKCDNPKCVNPEHLFAGTIADNVKDMVLKERHGRMLFTHEKARRIRALKEKYGRKLSNQRIADWFGVSKSAIGHMVTGRNWIYA